MGDHHHAMHVCKCCDDIVMQCRCLGFKRIYDTLCAKCTNHTKKCSALLVAPASPASTKGGET